METFEEVQLESPKCLLGAEWADDLAVEMWKENVKQHAAKLLALSQAKKMYSTIWKLLLKVMKNKVSSQGDFIERNTTGDVVWLVTTIHALVTNFNSTTPRIMSTLESLNKILNFQQTEKLENADYVKGLLA